MCLLVVNLTSQGLVKTSHAQFMNKSWTSHEVVILSLPTAYNAQLYTTGSSEGGGWLTITMIIRLSQSSLTEDRLADLG